MTQRDSLAAIVFDFDGTLADTNIDFAEMRRQVAEHLRTWGLYQPGIEETRYILEIVDWGRQHLAARPLDLERYDREVQQLMEEVELVHTSRAQLFPGVAESLSRLAAAGIKIGIITRNCQRGVASVLGRHPLPHDTLITRDDLRNVKPHPEHLERALAELEVPPEQALMVGDHPTDIEVGQALGVRTCGVLTAQTTLQEFHDLGADFAFRDVPALVEFLLDRKLL